MVIAVELGLTMRPPPGPERYPNGPYDPWNGFLGVSTSP